MLSKLRSNKKGFTLVELMIVIAIIGILAAIAIPNYIAFRNKAYCSGVEKDAQTIGNMISDYFSEGARTNIPDLSDLVSAGFKSENSFDLTGDPNTTLVIEVYDNSGRCPRGTTYQKSMPANTSTDGWQ